MSQFVLTIEGERISTGELFDVLSPFDESVVAR